MRISLNWLKQHVAINIPDDKLIRLIGSRLVEVEAVIDETHKYDHIFIVQVTECNHIPNTHLSLCKISLGKSTIPLAKNYKIPTDSTNSEFIQVVCGASNVRVGMLAVWLAPGAIVPASINEDAPFIIGKRRLLKKYDSFGMLAGADELDFSKEHNQIVEIDPAMAKPGDSFANLFNLQDLILDIENKSLTHRPDCFGLVGFAREVAGILDQPFIEPTSLSTILPDSLKSSSTLKITIADTSLCSRYSALILEKHGELSTKYLNSTTILLAKSGIQPLNPIVDMTNLAMILTGQPLHAFDYDKFIAVGKTRLPEIGVRSAQAGEKLTLLDAKTITLNSDDIIITSNKTPVALAGAMGGQSTMVDKNTRRIILESATFSLYNLRKTSMSHGIFTEAVTRFTKGQPSSQTLSSALFCADLLKTGFIVTEIADFYPSPSPQNVVKITISEINALLGTTYSLSQIVQTLTHVGFLVDTKASSTLKITVPIWRTDIHIKEDIIEEIGRLNGYDLISPTLPLHHTAKLNPMLDLKTHLRQILASGGANELLTYTFVHGNLLHEVGLDPKNSYKITNSISPQLEYIRPRIVPSLLVKAYDNLKNRHLRFALFEMNQVFTKTTDLTSEGTPQPHHHLAMVLCDKNSSHSQYYLAKKYLDLLSSRLGLQFILSPFRPSPLIPYYEPRRSAQIYLNQLLIGTLGEIKASVLQTLKLPLQTTALELDLEKLLPHLGEHQPNFEVSQFPTVERDLTLPVSSPYQTILDQINQYLDSQNLIYQVSPISIYQPDNSDSQNITFHLTFASRDRTLSSHEIQSFMTQLEKIH